MRRLLEWERDAMVIAYSSRENTDAIAEEFGVSRAYPRILAARRGLAPRSVGRPRSKSLQPENPVVVVAS